jgi:hypothetical protein
LKLQGDEEGHQVWMEVANRVQDLQLNPDQREN